MDKNQCRLLIKLTKAKIEQITLDLIEYNKVWNKWDVYTVEQNAKKDLCIRTLESLRELVK
ncbi:hypothetical protein N9987_00310 [bacterium]|nr:hypothetical protein [bacterium]